MSSVARSLWAEARPVQPPRRVWQDWLLVALVVASAVLEVAFLEDVGWGPTTVGFPLLLALALLWRRARPLAVVALVFSALSAISVAALASGQEPTAPYAWAWVLVLPYALLRWASGRGAAVGLAIMLAAAVLGIVIDFTGVLDAVVGMAFLLLPAALGASIRYRGSSRLREIEQAKLLEREQLARELHDTVAHHVSAIAIQAQAGRAVAASEPDRAVDALGVIEAAASRTLAEMRAMVGLLRDGRQADLAPQRGVTDLEGLARSGGGSPRVEVVLSGDLDGLSPSVEAAVYRLAQESVTNAVRHARHATRVDVRVAGDDDCVRLTVCDDGDARPVDEDAWGYGLIGMRERASLLGGTLEAGPRPDAGWTVRAVLPRSGAVA